MTRTEAILRDLTVLLRTMPELEATDLSGLDIRIRFDSGASEPSKVIVRPERAWTTHRRRAGGLPREQKTTPA